ncbi:MAG TPA: GDSL-type esterase/lipase family protein [Phycisphaerae bacterium]|nr:GDSL-type esterase/lipase family protein [Phycisphaerae bacterium]
MKYLAALSVVLTSVGVAQATTIRHVSGNISSWQGPSLPNSYGYLRDWPGVAAAGTFAEFDRGSLQVAINSAVAAYGAWDAKVVVTQVNWESDEPPASTGPVVVSVDIDRDTLVWGQSHSTDAGGGNWMYGGTSYANLVEAINAGAAVGDSVIVAGADWQAYYNTAHPLPAWDIIIDVPESLIAAYIANPSADAMFVTAELTGDRIWIFGDSQWGGAGDVRVEINGPPPGPWMVLDEDAFDVQVNLSSPQAGPLTVTVSNAGTPALAWTAAESPDETWMSLQDASGSDGDSFGILIDASSLTPGQYEGQVAVSDSGANNSPLYVSVALEVFAANTPVIDLTPDSLAYELVSLDPAPAGQPVTVSNLGSGALSWSAAVQDGPVGWLTLTDTSGSDGEAFVVHVDHSGLPGDVYTAEVVVTDPDAANSPQVLAITLELREQDADIDKANGYDDAWESGLDGWVAQMRTLHNEWLAKDASLRAEGLAVQLGDSITHANPYGQWPRGGSGKTPEDQAVTDWMHAGIWGDGTNNSANGWYLCAYDVGDEGRSFTAKGGITTSGYLLGSTNLPSSDEMFTAGFTNPDGKQYRDAEIAVVMLGTNDASGNRSAAAMIADLEALADKVLANKAIVVLSTIPPKRSDMDDVNAYNAAIRNLAQTRKLPLIDYGAEILRRRPGVSWDGTLISNDGIHPSAEQGGYTASSNPYLSNGEGLSHSGYLLRGWLSVQKIKEIKDKVIDGKPALVSSEPPADGTLAKTAGNVVLLTFDSAISLPGGAALTVAPLAGGGDQGGAFAYSVEPDGATLKAVEQGSVLTNSTWYRVAPAGGFDVEPFALDLCTLIGDANDSGRVTTADYVAVKARLGEYTDDRCDLNGNGRVTTADYVVVKDHMGSRTPVKP